MITFSTNERQKQSKKRESKWRLKWLRNPQMLRLLVQLGILSFNLLKWLVELLQD